MSAAEEVRDVCEVHGVQDQAHQ
eukprot:COSAG05_NODE_1147_length_5730_cov_3.054520_1_plen_22_part_10